MREIKETAARNIAALRTRAGLTQLELAEKLNYSDKAVSKWERGESLPDVTVLVEIADLFQVPLDYLVRGDAQTPPPTAREHLLQHKSHGFITGICLGFVGLLATLLFVILFLCRVPQAWAVFLYAVPAALVVWLVFNSLWFDHKWNYLIVSLLMWSVLAIVNLPLIMLFGKGVSLSFALGIPGQVIILLWYFLRRATHEKNGGH